MWQCGRFEFDTTKPLIMGILNVTPDSFSDGDSYQTIEAACAHARRMVAEGAAIIDIGGESTRPGSEEVTVSEELRRVLEIVHLLAAEDIAVSIDTRHAEVAQACLNQGAAIINDITGFTQNDMIEVAKRSDAGCIIMHMQGEPKTMQTAPHYEDVVLEVEAFLLAQAELLEAQGIKRERIAVDPGPGFGKNFEQNRALLRATGRLASHGYPLMASWSRKRFVGVLTGVKAPHERVMGSVAVALYAALNGASIFRVHDVAQTAEALNALTQITSA